MITSELQARLLADLHQFAVPRHARWDPLGLMAVRQATPAVRLSDHSPFWDAASA